MPSLKASRASIFLNNKLLGVRRRRAPSGSPPVGIQARVTVNDECHVDELGLGRDIGGIGNPEQV